MGRNSDVTTTNAPSAIDRTASQDLERDALINEEEDGR
jgi:hypothetical protein